MTHTPVPDSELPWSPRERIGAVALPAALAAAPWVIELLGRARPGVLPLIAAGVLSVALAALGVWITSLRRRHARAAELHRLELERLSLVDPLTGLGNRRAFERDLEPALRRARRIGVPVTLVCLDVDGIRGLNDEFGHACGDETLRSLGAVLRSTLRFGTDAAYRIGGDEFVAVLSADDSGARAVVDRVARGFVERSPRASRILTGTIPWEEDARIVDLVARAERRLKRRARGPEETAEHASAATADVSP